MSKSANDRVVIAEWPKGTEVVRVILCTYRGDLRLDIRQWFRKKGKLRPGTKGISISPRRLRKLAKAIDEARAIVRAAKA